MTDYSYLDNLISEVNELRIKMNLCKIDIAKCEISYMPTKKTSFVGFKQGYSEQLIKIQNGMRESDKLRSTTKDYLRFLKNEDGEIIQIENYKKGSLDCLFQVYWCENLRYLLPYSSEGGFYPTYVYVTKYEENRVVEEYMVQGKQIVYETYGLIINDEAEYSCINYVSGGDYPVRDIKKGKFSFDPLAYVENYSDNWLNYRQRN